MIFLKKLSINDLDKIYEIFWEQPQSITGFVNLFYGYSYQELKDSRINEIINHSKGINLPIGYVPYTFYLLMENDEIIGCYNVRHYLNHKLKNGAGHIGYFIVDKYRNKGYGTKGLKMVLNEVKDFIKEDEIYMSASATNKYSIKVQLNCGAKIWKQTETSVHTKINKKLIQLNLKNDC